MCEILFLSQKNKIDFLEKRFKEKDILTIMSVTRILPRCDGDIIMEDNGMDGFRIEYEDLLYYSELNGYPTLIFKCFDHYSKIFDIDCWLHF